MAKGIFVIGTDTDVGKTFVTATLHYTLKKNNYNVCSYKPIQSGGVLKNGQLVAPDIEFIKDIVESGDDYAYYNTYCFKEAVSPHLASELEQKTIELKDIHKQYQLLQKKHKYIIVEGAGGIVVPIIREQYYMYHMVKDLNLPVVVVARAGVGTINHTLLTINFLKSHGILIKGIIINGYNKTFYEEDNIKVIEHMTGLKVLSVIEEVKKNNEDFIKNARKIMDKSMKLQTVLDLF